jgi:hypothetical protein
MINETDLNKKQADAAEEKGEGSKSDDLFTSYILSLLKRDVSLPVLKSDLVNELNDNEINAFAINIINFIKYEYIEKQKAVILEFQKRSFEHIQSFLNS